MASKAETIRSIRAEYAAESGSPVSKDTAEILLDRMAEAFCHKVEGAGYEYAVQEDPRTARYLMWVWQGEEGRKLRAALNELGY